MQGSRDLWIDSLPLAQGVWRPVGGLGKAAEGGLTRERQAKGYDRKFEPGQAGSENIASELLTRNEGDGYGGPCTGRAWSDGPAGT